VVAAHQDQSYEIIQNINKRLDLPVSRRPAGKHCKVFDGSDARRGELFGRGQTFCVIGRFKP